MLVMLQYESEGGDDGSTPWSRHSADFVKYDHRCCGAGPNSAYMHVSRLHASIHTNIHAFMHTSECACFACSGGCSPMHVHTHEYTCIRTYQSSHPRSISRPQQQQHSAASSPLFPQTHAHSTQDHFPSSRRHPVRHQIISHSTASI